MALRLARKQLHSVQLVPITPFDAQGALALEPLRMLVRRLREAGITVFLPCAGSAEFHSLTADEIVQAVAAVREAAGPQSVVIAPVGRQLEEAVSLGRRSCEAGADGVLVMPLDFPYLSDAGAGDYYRALLDRLDCPAMIYKKGDPPGDELLLDLSGHPRLYGVKYATNDMDAFARAVRRDQGRMDWYCGSAERYAPFYALAGAPGYTSGAGNLCPRLTLAMHRALVNGDYAAAMKLHETLGPIELYRARAGSSYNVSFLKYAIRLTGIDCGDVRPPQRRLTAAEMREIDAIVQPLLAAEKALA